MRSIEWFLAKRFLYFCTSLGLGDAKADLISQLHAALGEAHVESCESCEPLRANVKRKPLKVASASSRGDQAHIACSATWRTVGDGWWVVKERSVMEVCAGSGN